MNCHEVSFSDTICISINYDQLFFRIKDIEDYFCSKENPCKLCIPKNTERNGVLTFPRKEKKTKVSEKSSLVCILECEDKVCLLQRPKSGLLANLYEFPTINDVVSGIQKASEIQTMVKNYFEIKPDKPISHGEITHQFSHITQKYLIWSAKVPTEDIKVPENHQNVSWIDKNNVLDGEVAISTAMKKVFQHFKKGTSVSSCKKRKVMTEKNLQPSILKFFKK